MPSSEKAATKEIVLRQPCQAVPVAVCSTPLVQSQTRGMSCLSPCREPALFTFVVMCSNHPKMAWENSPLGLPSVYVGQ